MNAYSHETRTPEQIRLSKKAYRKRKILSKKKRVKSEKLKRKKEQRLRQKEANATADTKHAPGTEDVRVDACATANETGELAKKKKEKSKKRKKFDREHSECRTGTRSTEYDGASPKRRKLKEPCRTGKESIDELGGTEGKETSTPGSEGESSILDDVYESESDRETERGPSRDKRTVKKHLKRSDGTDEENTTAFGAAGKGSETDADDDGIVANESSDDKVESSCRRKENRKKKIQKTTKVAHGKVKRKKS